MISCRRCGRQLPETARFCDRCGQPIPQAPAPPPPQPERRVERGPQVEMPRRPDAPKLETVEPRVTAVETKPRGVSRIHVSRRAALAGAVLIVLILIGLAGGTRPPTSSVKYVTTTSYVTSVRNELVTTTRLEQITVTEVTGSGTQLVEHCFSPGGDCATVLIRWISSAKTSIHVLIYSFTLDNVRDALIQAKNRGVDVKVVFDEGQAHGQGSEYSNLKAAGVDVRVDTGSGLMHDKVAIIDSHIIITGSFNWSQAGNQENNENLIVIDSSSWAAAYEQQFQLIYNAASVATITGIFTTRISASTRTTWTSTGTWTTHTTTSGTRGPNCDPSYPTVCIPSPPPDLDCGEIPYRNFLVLPPDPHRFDGDKDGIGCET